MEYPQDQPQPPDSPEFALGNGRLAFFAYAYNLAEVTRGLEIARVLRDRGVDIAFFTHGGPHEDRIKEAGFSLTTLQPLITGEKHEALIGVEQGRTFHGPFKTKELFSYVDSEVEALRSYHPMGVYFGLNLPCVLSSRVLGLPLIMVLPTAITWTYFQHGLGSYPESHEKLVSRWLPRKFKDRLFNKFMLRLSIGIRAFNRVAEHYGLPPLKSYFRDIFSGDLTLLADLPELTGLPETVFPPNFHYIGPLFAHLPLSVPEEVKHVFNRDGTNIYLSMGSSAQPSLLKKAASILSDSDYNVVITTTSIMDPAELGPMPENVHVTRYLPAPEVNEMADIAVTHGGQGTIQTACWAGTPVVGVALQFEQQANLDMIVRAGMGIRIPMRHFKRDRLLEAIATVAENPSYSENALRMKNHFRKINGAIRSADIILEFFRNRKIGQ